MEKIVIGNNVYKVKRVLNRIEHNEYIKKHIDKLKENLIIEDSNKTIYTKTEPKIELSEGCKACKQGTWWCLFLGNNCNASCKFCSQEKTYKALHAWSHPRTVVRYWIDDVKFYLDKFGHKFTGFSYSGGEPLLYLDKMEEIGKYVLKSRPHLYQWVYTNGILLNEYRLKKMKEIGIKEVRVDLASTNFDKKIVKKLELVKKIIGKVTVEVPSIPEVFKKLVNENYLKIIVDLGVEQLNLAELELVQPINWETYTRGEEVYYYDMLDYGWYSPVYSRNITYLIMEYAIKEKINILINDCSNDAKHLQKVMRKENAPFFYK